MAGGRHGVCRRAHSIQNMRKKTKMTAGKATRSLEGFEIDQEGTRGLKLSTKAHEDCGAVLALALAPCLDPGRLSGMPRWESAAGLPQARIANTSLTVGKEQEL